MAFAVVAFDEEKESYSEVPVSWLTKNNTMCWWPKFKTPSNYMIRGVQPNPSSWILCKVKVEGFYPTLEKARKMAQDRDYTSSEENIRKRKRRRYSDIEYQDSTSGEEHSTTRSVTPPPQMIEGTLTVTDFNNMPFIMRTCEKKLPLCNITNINEFEEFISDNEKHNIFVNFISTIGGREVKNNIHRCLKTIFTNDVATKCSWLGQRGNFCVYDLASTTTVKDVMQSTYTITQKQFEVICSEWFQLAKLRITPKQSQNQAIQL
ncbi:hypothetical protein RN001_005774 [Aquatica leii]|uniref:DUF4806 domain-containing protein n=1 Tax=Aquatica leii TaxID=1421715 RepID=A0AAN7Q8B2_9COLE|nr:hypothetical protein RN001_005774 [Aquatica leii]